MDDDSLAAAEQREPFLEVQALSKRYVRRTWFSHEPYQVTALDAVNLTIPRNSSLALLGESGAGKSTLARCLVGLEQPDAGEIRVERKALASLDKTELTAVRHRIQLVFQDSATSLNPRFSAAQIIEEPLRIQSRTDKKGRRELVLDMMERVGLSPSWAERLPVEFSGGQRQRLSIARALIQKPELLIFDEILSGLDLSIQAQIINLLLDFQAAFSLTYLFITHNIRVAAYVADDIAVMHRGRIVELGPALDVLSRPKTAYTQLLVASIPGGRARSAGFPQAI